MHAIFFTIVGAIERVIRLFGVDVFTQLDTSGQGLFSFERRDHGKGDREYFGLGLHIVVSPLR